MGTEEAALKNADTLVIRSEWKNFKAPDFDFINSELTPDKHGQAVLFDGRNLFDPERVKSKGFVYWPLSVCWLKLANFYWDKLKRIEI